MILRKRRFSLLSISVEQNGPLIHSVHCILDVQDCADSPFHIIPPAIPGAFYYDKGWRLDDAAKAVAVAIAQQTAECENGCVGDQATGLYVSMEATVVKKGDNAMPTLITATEMTAATPEDNVCGDVVMRPPFPIPRVGDEVCIEGYLMVSSQGSFVWKTFLYNSFAISNIIPPLLLSTGFLVH